MDEVLLIDKPKGWTSFDVVAKVRNAVNNRTVSGVSQLGVLQGGQERQTQPNAAELQQPAGMTGFAGQQGRAVRKSRVKVGHAGTLDPLATGLLIVLVGNATKRQDDFMKQDKVYEVAMKLGETSTTADEEGEKTHVSALQPDKQAVEEAIRSFVGTISQIPPAYSAIKIDGQRAYKLARAGKEVKIEPRTVTIYAINQIEYEYPTIRFVAKVSSGTYIRSLVTDIGETLGTGAYMTDLRRTQIGTHSIQNAVAPEDALAGVATNTGK